MYQRILVPVDGSACSDVALEEALELARAHDAELRVLHVIVTLAWPPLDVEWSPQLVEDALWGAGESLVATAVERARQRGVQAAARLRQGHPVSRVIAGEAMHWPADLIVMGTHGHVGLARLLLGSVTEAVICATLVPVLAVRAHAAAAGSGRLVSHGGTAAAGQSAHRPPAPVAALAAGHAVRTVG